jgi:uncharacterized phage-associated protein
MEFKMYSPQSIANYFLEIAGAAGHPVSPLRLQKLVYYAHGWYIGYTGLPLINETVKAWEFGPCIPSLFYEFSRYGKDPITSMAQDPDRSTAQPCPAPANQEIREFLQNVFVQYNAFTDIALSKMAHAPGTPWDLHLHHREENGVTDISFTVLKAHFVRLVHKTMGFTDKNSIG